jgi:hypothetical protein
MSEKNDSKVTCSESNENVKSMIYDPNGNAMTFGEIVLVINDQADELQRLRSQLAMEKYDPEIHDDEEEIDTEDPTEDWLRCGCTLCFCFTRTEYGQPCLNCQNGAHQG